MASGQVVAWLVVVVALFILAVQLFVTLIEFKLKTLAGFVLVPFGLFGKTAFLAERVLGNVIASGVKVLVFGVIVGIGTTLFGHFTQGFGGNQPSLEDALSLLLTAMSLLGLGIFGPGIATGLTAGAPALGAGAALGTALAAGGLGVAGATACVPVLPPSSAPPAPSLRRGPLAPSRPQRPRTQARAGRPTGPAACAASRRSRTAARPRPKRRFRRRRKCGTSASARPACRRAIGSSSPSATCFWRPGLACSLVWQAARGTVTPWVVEIDKLGQAQAVAPAIADYRPTDPQIAWHLARLIENVRSIPADPVIVRQNWLAAYDFATDKGADALNDYARADDPFSKIGKIEVTVEISSVIRASTDSFRVAWIERRYENGSLAATEHWTAILTLVIDTPHDAEHLRSAVVGNTLCRKSRFYAGFRAVRLLIP